MADELSDVAGVTQAPPRDGRNTGKTSERHSGILNGYKAGNTPYIEWVRNNLGDIRLENWSWGAASFAWTIDDRYVFPDGVMFGGHIASVGDHIAAIVTMTVLPESEQRFRTSRLETQFFRPVMKPSVRIEGRVVNISRSLINVEADYFNTADKLAVRISATQVMRPPSASS